MAPQRIPPEPMFASSAEQEVHAALAGQLPPEAVLFAALRFTDEAQDREADLVVAWPGVGVAVIEVKGGFIGRESGRWMQRQAGRDTPIWPVEQALTCKYMLRDYLRGHPRWTGSDVRMAHLVAFPHTRIGTDFAAPDCPRWTIVDRDDMPVVARRVRAALERQQGQPAPPTADDVAEIVDCLAGRMLPQRDPIAEVAARERHCDLLTQDQARVLDYLRSNRRIEIRGGAGSGKTWLAVEQARRLAARGERVALLCYSRGLAKYLQRRVAGLRSRERPAYVGTFHNLGITWGAPAGADDDSDYYERRLPEAMVDLAHVRPVHERFDAVVVDEAQDFADAWWSALLASLREPGTGGLYVFADEGQRVFARHGTPPVALVAVDLDENLRNTKQIAQTFGGLTTGQMRYRGGEGAPVRFVACPTDEAVTVASDEGDALLEAGWAPEHVALLTTGQRHPVQREQQAHGQDAYWEQFWAGTDMFYGHVLGFKGLERPAVVLAVNGFRDESRAREMLYVGLSRARDLLVVCGDPELIERVGGEGVMRRLRGRGQP